MRASGSALAALSLLALAGCPGSNSGVGSCAGVSCAPGRTCVAGSCVALEGEAGLGFGDARVDAPYGPSEAGAGLEGARPEAGSAADLARPADQRAPDTRRPDTRAPDTRVPDTRAPDTRKPDLVPPGKWYQASSQVCPTFCAGLGRANVASPEGARCMSGEVRPASGVAAGIAFVYGCWPSCAAMGGAIASVSVGTYCYYPGQKQDGDGSDLTVGCFCR